MTFLDLRLLASELENVDWESFNKEDETPEEESALDGTVDSPGEDSMGEDDAFDVADAALEASQDAPSGGQTVVELSKLARPGAVASGSVKFGSGASAEWILDQLGRLALNNATGEPTQEDIQDFQVELQKALTGV
jgi:hypothetical protein